MKVPKLTQGENLGSQIAETGDLAIEIPAEFKDLFDISKNMEGVIPRLPQIKIIHRGQLFEMPDESKIGDFEGIILDQHPANAWWKQDISESGGNAIPDCFSMDGIKPEDNCEDKQNDVCATCNQNQFGSDRKGGGGKDCKNMKRLHILMEGSLLPRRLTIPPTSIKSFDLYMTGLVDRGLPYACVVSGFKLDKKISKTFEFAEVKIINKRVLTKEEIMSVASFIKQYRESARKQEIHADEYVSEEDTESQQNKFDGPWDGDDPGPQDDDIPY